MFNETMMKKNASKLQFVVKVNARYLELYEIGKF